MATKRKTRKTDKAEAELAAFSNSNIDKLLVAQAAYEYGTNAWTLVADKLSKHALTSKPIVYTPQSCNAFYLHLMSEAGHPISDESTKPRSKTNQELAKHLFNQRFDELKHLIAAEEAIFNEKTREIAEIKAGTWDAKISGKDNVDDNEEPEAALKEATPPPATPPPEDESFTVNEDKDEDDVAPGTNEVIDVDAINDSDVTVRPNNPGNVGEDDVEVEVDPDIDDVCGAEAQQEQDDDESDREESPVRRRSKRKGTPGVDSPRSPKRGREESDDNDNENDIENDTGDDSAALPSTRRRPRANTTGTGTAAASNKKIQNLLLALHQQIHQHKCGAIFHQPIRAGDAPDYHVLVYRPLDLKTIKARVRTGEIATVDEYRRDISLMFANAMMYNRPSSDVYKMAEEMNNDVEGYINDFMQTQGYHRGR